MVEALVRKKNKKLEEKELIDRALKGDELAFAVLYKRYHSQVYGFCSRLLRKRFDVEDAVQQVFLEAWRSMGRFEGRSLFSTWLTKIAIHTCLSFHRRGAKLMLSPETTKFDQKTALLWRSLPTLPDEEMFLKERKIMVNKLLARMTAKKKVVFMMADMQEMTAPEISTVLNIPDATVRTRLFHARREFVSWVSKNRNYREVFLSK